MNFDNSNEKFEYNVAFVETPLEIVKLMIDLISKNKKSKILDPGCGKGNFIKQLRENGYENITGVELNKKFSNYCRKTYPNASIINKDFLKIEKTNQYDVIIGNPPYSHYNSLPSEIRKEVTKVTGTKETDIYHAFIIQAIELLAEGGELIFIVPYGFFTILSQKKFVKK